MSRDWFDRPMPAMPSREDIDRHTDEAYDKWRQEQVDAEAERCAKHADERTFIKGSEHGKN